MEVWPKGSAWPYLCFRTFLSMLDPERKRDARGLKCVPIS